MYQSKINFFLRNQIKFLNQKEFLNSVFSNFEFLNSILLLYTNNNNIKIS